MSIRRKQPQTKCELIDFFACSMCAFLFAPFGIKAHFATRLTIVLDHDVAAVAVEIAFLLYNGAMLFFCRSNQ